MDIKNLHKVYFIGIGGIGMSALARYFNERQVVVSGYDRVSTELTCEMESEGIRIHYEDDISLMDKTAELVIYTPAIPEDHAELNFCRKNHYEVVKRSDVLQAITRNLYAITVAGSHGKTTISTLIAHILRSSGFGCNAFLGGTSLNYNTNYWSSENNVAVIEADEYDRSFLKLSPDIAILTAMDPDHLDIYGTAEAMEEAFIQYTANIREGGLLVYKYGLKRSNELKASRIIQYSLENPKSEIYAEDICKSEDGYRFKIIEGEWILDETDLHGGGLHNVENTVAAVCVAHQLGIAPAAIKKAVAGFRGVKRRFEVIIRTPEIVFIDDYAHHPEELKAMINGAKSLYPQKPCTVIFQPHLYSRTRDLAGQFADSLDLADKVILLPIYPARELPIAGVSSASISRLMKKNEVSLMDKMQVIDWLKLHTVKLLITCGAGDIDQLISPIKQILEKK